MKAKKVTQKTFTPISAIAAGFALATSAHAQTTPVFNYSFPSSWDMTGTTITDLSSAGNNGTFDGTLTLDSTIPPGATGGAQSLNTTSGGILTTGAASLANSAIATAGGFTFNVSFMWNGTDSSSFGHTEKIVDYAGTESLQLVTTTGSASLQMAFADDKGNETIAVSTNIVPNTWYTVSLTFNTTGNSLDGNGDISGLASMVVNGGIPIVASATKGTYGDSLNRPIGLGQLGANFGYLVGLNGDIYDPSVTLGVVPAPAAPYFLTPTVQDGSVNLTLVTAPGFTYEIDSSTDLTSWTTLTNIASTNGTIQFTDTNAANSSSKRFYRAVFTN